MDFQGYYDEWVLLKSKEMLKEEDEEKKKKASNDSVSDKRSSQVSHDSQASSDDDSNACTCRDKIKRIQKIDLNASDVDKMKNAR